MVKPEATDAASLHNERTIALIEHLSKEIETQVNSMTVWRNRVNFTAFFGPWILLGAAVALDKINVDWERLKDPDVLWMAGGLAAVYILFGQGCAAVERGAWKQCNEWRVLIAELHAGTRKDVKPPEMTFREVLRVSYLGVYFLMAVAFLLGAGIAWKCSDASTDLPARIGQILEDRALRIRIEEGASTRAGDPPPPAEAGAPAR